MSEKIVLTKMELLKMARELCINEYIDKRAQDHNKWLADAEVEWKTRGINLPYPTFPVYPTEADILSRATVLNTFLSQESQEQKSLVDSIDLTPVVPESIPVVEPIEAKVPETIPTVELPSPILPAELPIIPMVTPAVIQPELLPANVWNNIAPTVQSQTPAPVTTIPPLPEPGNIETTLSVIEQLKAKLGIK